MDDHILVLDDEPGITLLCSRLLKRAGYNVIAFTEAPPTYEYLSTNNVNLLLVDIRMPDVNGFEVISRAKELQPDIAVLVMTGFGTVETAIQALRQGVDGLLLKPFEQSSELIETVKQALLDSGRYTTNDIVQGTIGINRIAGTGLIFTDMLTEGSLDRKLEMLANFSSQYLSGFTVGIRTLKDAVAAFSEEEAKFRDVREDLLGPTKANIPFLSQTLPEKPSPLESTQKGTEHPALRQLTGLSVKTANIVGTEMNKLGVEFSAVRSMSGNAAMDRETDRLTGQFVERTIKPFNESPGYEQIKNSTVKRFLLESSLSYVRSQARQQALTTHPELAKQEKLESVPKRIRDLIVSLTGFDLGK